MECFTRDMPEYDIEEHLIANIAQHVNCPIPLITWYAAAAYCNWLSKSEGLPEEQWCYVANKNGSFSAGMTIPTNALIRTGYRLPTEQEWELSCRAGGESPRYYGNSISLLPKYATFLQNSNHLATPCGSHLPNDLGMFDTLGNMYEWCINAIREESKTDIFSSRELTNKATTIDDSIRFVCRSASFDDDPRSLRSAFRAADHPTGLSNGYGFRLCRTLSSE